MADFVNGKLTKKILFQGEILAITGLHIGGSGGSLSIGSADATIVRNPLNNQPYIPGSSLKGKMRSLVEKVEGKFGEGIGNQIQAGPYLDTSDNQTLIPKLFGTMPEKMKEKQPTSRLIVRDCDLINHEELLNSANTDMPYTEVKTEVMIDRITSAATPRQMERVPSGARFRLQMILNIYDGDNESQYINKVFESLCLVQNDYIGGKGTRGSGEISIKLSEKLKFKDKETYEKQSSWADYENNNTIIPEELKNL